MEIIWLKKFKKIEPTTNDDDDDDDDDDELFCGMVDQQKAFTCV